MSTLQQLSVEEVKVKLNQENLLLIDVRDAIAYQRSHIPGAQHLSNENLAEFLRSAKKSSIVIVYCYKGFSSQSAANFLLEEGFVEVYSMSGGFDAWMRSYPETIA